MSKIHNVSDLTCSSHERSEHSKPDCVSMSAHLHYSTTLLTLKKYSEIKQLNVKTLLFHKITTTVSHKGKEICHAFHIHRVALFLLQQCPIKMHKNHKSEQY